MEYVYLVEHCYEYDTYQEETKFIGVFSSEKEATEIIKKLHTKSGFKDYPIKCFKIHKIKINEFCWKDGFIKWEEANNE